MSVSSPCEICQRADVTDSCNRCGQLVCQTHFDADRGLCVDCVAEVGGGQEPGRTTEDMPDGVDTYRS